MARGIRIDRAPVLGKNGFDRTNDAVHIQNNISNYMFNADFARLEDAEED